MKNLYVITILAAFCLSISFSQSQNLDFTNPAPTGTGNATIALVATPPSVLLNGEAITTAGALVGVFYENDSGDLICAGFVELNDTYLNGGNVSIAAWVSDSGEDNGLANGEIGQFYLNLNGIDYPAGDIIFSMGEPEIYANDMMVISEINFSAAGLEPCTCIDGTASSIISNIVCFVPSGGCADPLATNYCFAGDLNLALNNPDCQYSGGIEGCTCEAANNYDPEATQDDGSCIVDTGCSNELANNFTDCENIEIITESCEIPGCTCPIAYNYSSDANFDDGSCFLLGYTGEYCTDPNSPNFTQGCGNELNAINSVEESCESSGECELENIIWDYTITDANMTIQVGADVVTLNNESPPNGSLLGVFFTNDNNELVCGGYQEWTGEQLAIAAWGAESGFDNGFQAGEEFTWLLKVGNQTFNSSSTSMNDTYFGFAFATAYEINGQGMLGSASFECDLDGIWGCTDETAYNYNANATIDDDSCFNLDWTVTPTDCNMTILINSPEIDALDISLNGEAIPNGAFIGVFFENENGELVCGGSSQWTGTSGAVPAWGSEAGADNGFQVGEAFTTWALLIGNQTIPMDDNGATMNVVPGVFSDTYSCNGFGNLLAVNFEGEYNLTYGCTDSDACNYDNTAILDDNTCDYGQIWYQDSDGDGLGNPDFPVSSCDEEVSGFVTNNDDPCPDTENNPNNSVIWYLDSDSDGLGENIPVEFGCDYPGSDDFPLADNNTDPCPYDPDNLDEDNDGICDDVDDCVGQYDALGVCGGTCNADIDEDGICDDVDDCVGQYDVCGVCNGPDDIFECGCADIPEGECDCNGNTLDAIGVCGGTCNADIDEDGICDDVDDCVGQYDALGECNGDCESDVDEDEICDSDEIQGCQDPIACNFNPNATDEDGSCTYVTEGQSCAGCTDINACNFNPEASIDDGSCLTIFGCTDESACNYNEEAQCDNGSCIAPTIWYLDNDGDGLGFDGLGLFSFESCNDSEIGYIDNNIDNNDGDFDNDNISGIDFNGDDCDDTNPNIGSPSPGYDCSGTCINDADGDNICDEFEINGCQDSAACNYDEFATDSGECDYPNEFYDCNNNCLIDTDLDGTCDELEIEGCTDVTACNYNETATEENNLCTYTDGVCDTCENGEIIDNDIDNDSICNEDEISGCQDTTACNFNPEATDEGNCEYAVEYYDCNEICLIDSDGDGTCDELEIEGCTDATACNFNSEATESIETCTYLEEICDTCENGEVIDNDIDNDGVCNDDEIPGCTDPTACNFDPDLGCTDDDGSCFYSQITVEFDSQDASCEAICDGVIELIINNGQPPYVVEYNLVDDDGNIETILTGGNLTTACSGTYAVMVSDAYNCESEVMMIYVNAIEPDSDQDGVCDNDEILGCIDFNACNYNELATEEDNCEYCYSDLGDIDGNGIDDCQLINDQAVQEGNPIIYDCNGCINDIDFDGVCDEYEVFGCTDTDACNYSPEATDDCNDLDNNGILDCCEYPIYFLDCNGNCLNDSDGDGVCDEEEINGCIDDEACNFNPLATDSGECLFPSEAYLDCNEECVNDTDGDGVCDEIEVIGCQNGDACNFNPLATDQCENCCAFLDEDGDGLPDMLSFIDNIENLNCPGGGNGAFVMYTTGGTGPYTLNVGGQQLSSSDGVFAVGDLAGGSYNAFITDSNGCVIVQTVDIEEPAPIEINIEYLNYVSCEGFGDGSLTSSIQGGTPPYVFQWVDQFGTFLSSTQDILDLDAGAYALEVIDNYGCQAQAAFIVGDPNPLNLELLNVNNVTCYNGNNGNIEIFVSGGASPYTDIYTDINGNLANPNALTEGDYLVTVTDNNGCVIIDEFSISQPDLLEVNISPSNSIICEDETTSITATSGFDNYIWTETLSGAILNDNDNVLNFINESGVYMVTAVDENGCEAMSESTTITVFNNPIININGPSEGITGNLSTYYVVDGDDGDEYQWSIENSSMGTINGSSINNSVDITWNLQGIAQVYLTQTNEGGCSSTEFIDVAVEWPISINELSNTIDFIVYPNPFTDYATIELNNPRKLYYDLYLYDAKGSLVTSFRNKNDNQIKLNRTFTSGIYHLQLISSEGNKRKLIVVE
ncbi:MAG: hypothetical protein CMP49_04125 [Flavobacteriales bacterium]|nr:hypothetical protein [Flavobacteriales bacterium]